MNRLGSKVDVIWGEGKGGENGSRYGRSAVRVGGR